MYVEVEPDEHAEKFWSDEHGAPIKILRREMFFCDACKDKNNWPDSIGKSYGRCEVCGRTDACNDVPSRYLPTPVQRDTWEIIDNRDGSVTGLVDVPRGNDVHAPKGFCAYNTRTKEVLQGKG